MGSIFGWALVALCFALSVASRSISDSFVVFVPALEQAFAAPRREVTLIYSFALLVGGVASPLAGWILDRFGLRVLTMIGIGAAALGTAGGARATELWQLYICLGIVLGFSSAALSGVLTSSLIPRWFPASRMGVPLAVSWSATGIGTMITFPAAQYMIATDGWPHAENIFALASAAFLPLLLVLPWQRIERGAPGLAPARGSAAAAGPTVREALRDWPFWALSGSFTLTAIGSFTLFPQTMVYLLERGLDGAYAARALAVSGILTSIGVVGFSWLADRAGRRLAALLAYGSSIAGIASLAMVQGPGDDHFLWGFVILFGGAMGSRGPMISTLASLRYRGAHFGRIYGLICIGIGLGGFFGAWVGGALHDLTGGYAGAMLVSAGAFVIAAFLLGGEANAAARRRR